MGETVVSSVHMAKKVLGGRNKGHSHWYGSKTLISLWWGTGRRRSLFAIPFSSHNSPYMLSSMETSYYVVACVWCIVIEAIFFSVFVSCAVVYSSGGNRVVQPYFRHLSGCDETVHSSRWAWLLCSVLL